MTGAPILLLNLINCLRNAGYICNRIIIKNKDGVLIDEFLKNAEVLFFNDSIKNTSPTVLKKILKPLLVLKEKKNHSHIQQWIDEADLVFSNTITNGDFFDKFNFISGKIIVSYIHELQIATDFYTNLKNLKIVLEKTTNFCVPAEAVSSFLQHQFHIGIDKITKLNYFIPLNVAAQNEQIKPSKEHYIVGMIGTLDWRKGAEILPLIILDFFNKYPIANLQFSWKGANKSSIEYKHIEYELKKTGLSDKVVFEESTRDVDSFYTAIDLLLLCSKEDPYPLVVLEAASFKKPCICFANAGGACEFIQNDAGTIVPYLDINAITTAIHKYYSDKDKSISEGANAYRRYLELHFDELLIQSQFKQLFSSALS